MENSIGVSATSIDNALWSMSDMCKAMESSGVRNARNVYSAVQWYVGTSRASVDWVRRFINLDREAMMQLIMKAAQARDGSMSGIVKSINRAIKYKVGDVA